MEYFFASKGFLSGIGVAVGCGILLALLYVILRGVRLKKHRTLTTKDEESFRNEVSNLMTDFNRVANININLLEDKVEDLKRVIQLADEKIIKLNTLIVDLEIVKQRGSSKKIEASKLDLPEIPPFPKKLLNRQRNERIKQLAKQGYLLEEIARTAEVSLGEVQLIVGLGRRDGN